MTFKEPFWVFFRKRPEILPKPNFQDNWKKEQYDKNILSGLKALQDGKLVSIYDDGRGYELALEIKHRFILEYQKQLSEKIKITFGAETITISIEA